MPRMDLYLTAETDRLLRTVATELNVSRSAYIRYLIMEREQEVTIDVSAVTSPSTREEQVKP